MRFPFALNDFASVDEEVASGAAVPVVVTLSAPLCGGVGRAVCLTSSRSVLVPVCFLPLAVVADAAAASVMVLEFDAPVDAGGGDEEGEPLCENVAGSAGETTARLPSPEDAVSAATFAASDAAVAVAAMASLCRSSTSDGRRRSSRRLPVSLQDGALLPPPLSCAGSVESGVVRSLRMCAPATAAAVVAAAVVVVVDEEEGNGAAVAPWLLALTVLTRLRGGRRAAAAAAAATTDALAAGKRGEGYCCCCCCTTAGYFTPSGDVLRRCSPLPMYCSIVDGAGRDRWRCCCCC